MGFEVEMRGNKMPWSATSSLNAFQNFDALVPEQRHENSPAFQRWVAPSSEIPSPGTTENLVIESPVSRPFGTQESLPVQPSVETLGYCRMSFRDNRPAFTNGIGTDTTQH